MLNNYLKTTLRSLWKSKGFVFFNVLGLGTSLACCIVAYLNYRYATDFDTQHIQASTIYRVNFERDFQGQITKHGIAPMPLRNQLKQNVAGIDNMVRYIPTNEKIKVNDDLFRTNIAYVDPEFLRVFTFPLLYGSVEGLSDRTNIYITSEYAIKYFGRLDVIGEAVSHLFGEQEKQYTVAGVFEKIPLTNSFYFDAVSNFDNFFELHRGTNENDWKQFNTLFLQISDEKLLPLITGQLQQYRDIQNRAREDFMVSNYYLDPLEGMSVRAERENLLGHWFRDGMPSSAMIAPVIMAVLILLIACFNFTNTSIATSSRRLKEIGIRKVLGGVRKELIVQFFAENLLLCIVSLFVAMIIARFLVPEWNELWPFLHLDLNYGENPGLVFFLLMSLLFIGFAAGSYPAFYISGFRPTSILKGTFKISGTNKLTQILLTLQFSISIMAIISGMAFYQNALYQEELDYGFNKDGVIFARFEKAADVQKFKNTLEGHTAVTAIAESNHHFFSSYFRDPVQFEEQLREVDVMDVTNDYINVVGMKMLEGRNFTEDSESDRREGIIVNEEFIKTFGWKEAIGKRVVWRDTISLFVVGVVKDFYTRGLWNPIEPMMMKYAAEENYRHLIVSANVPDLVKVNEYMKEQWKELFPGTLYTGEFMDEEIEEASTINNNIIKVFLFLGAIALLLSAIGLYSLVSLNIIKKMKEIGIRKVHGASVFHIIQKVNKEFAIILIISFVFGIGGGYYMVKMLMQSIWSYYQDSNAITYLGAILLIIIVAMVTVGYKIYKAATTNPVHVLRDE